MNLKPGFNAGSQCRIVSRTNRAMRFSMTLFTGSAFLALLLSRPASAEPFAVNISISAANSYIGAGGSTTLTATVTKVSDGSPVSGAGVNFTVSPLTSSLSSSSGTTDGSGNVSTTVNGGTLGEYDTVTATTYSLGVLDSAGTSVDVVGYQLESDGIVFESPTDDVSSTWGKASSASENSVSDSFSDSILTDTSGEVTENENIDAESDNTYYYDWKSASHMTPPSYTSTVSLSYDGTASSSGTATASGSFTGTGATSQTASSDGTSYSSDTTSGTNGGASTIAVEADIAINMTVALDANNSSAAASVSQSASVTGVDINYTP